MDLGTSAPHIHIHSDGDDLSIRRLHLISIESLRTMKSCHPIKSQKVRNSYLVGSRRMGGKDLRDEKSVTSEGRFRVLLDSWKRKTISYAEGLFLHTRWGPHCRLAHVLTRHLPQGLVPSVLWCERPHAWLWELG
jgi:hypothetical protein